MTSLADVYETKGGGLRRLYLGTGLFVAGAVMTVVAIVVATTSVLEPFGVDLWGAREIAGVLAGLGVPAVFLGIFSVLPANRVQRAAAAVGASLAVLGVMLFRYVYWQHWSGPSGMPSSLTVLVVGVYFLGTMTTFWCLFTAVATFKRRNDPGGTVTLTVTRDGETRTVEVAESSLDEARKVFGGVGIIGNVDEPDDVPDSRPGTPAARAPGRSGPHAQATSDGGSATDDISSPLDDSELLDEPQPEPATDRYCGNCASFEYVRTNQGFQPYCLFHDEQMDDMEACEQWQPNS